MTVRQFIERLKQFPEDAIVVASVDSEGNYFSTVDVGGLSIYNENSIYLTELTEELRELGYTEEDLCEGDDGQLAIVLWPE